jgi:glycerate kinase
MHVLVAPDKFKGSLTAAEVAGHIVTGLRRVAGDGLTTACVPVADGGDGTLDAAFAVGFEPVPVRASGPTGERVDAAYGRRGDMAVVELASVCGLAMLPGGRHEALRASSFGVGEVIGAAMDAGCARIVLAVGGSASTDGGAGMLQALGAQVRDRAGASLARGGGALRGARSLDLSGLHPAVRRTEFILASDVDNPLYGPHGAAAVYGPQKGASPADVAVLDEALRQWAAVVMAAGVAGPGRAAEPRAGRRAERRAGWAAEPGAGAAGGVGFGALAVLGASLRPGIGMILELTGFAGKVAAADLVITGEGSLDEQTLRGKAPAGVAAAARDRGVPVIAIAGRVSLPADRLAAAGISRAYALSDIEPDPARCMAAAGPLLEKLAGRVASDWLTEAAGLTRGA